MSEIEKGSSPIGLLWYCGNTGVLSPSWSCGKTCPLEMLEALLLIYLDAECNPACSQIVIILPSAKVSAAKPSFE